MKCPDCGEELVTKQRLGQGVLWCEVCQVSWFILRIARPKWLKRR